MPSTRQVRPSFLTSADFGRAYITEGWASRFLTELFRRSEAILFVGYSVSDPAIRYAVDAFAADRDVKHGHVATAYIITSDRTAPDERTWRNRGIEPIVYDERDNHYLLHETLTNCANRHTRGLFDRASIVLELGSQNPIAAIDRDTVSQMAWALKDDTGYAARRFAEVRPAAPAAWVDILSNEGLFDPENLAKLAACCSSEFRMPSIRLFPSSGRSKVPMIWS
jgi:hypothetical protein